MGSQTQWDTDAISGVTSTARDTFTGNPISNDVTTDGVNPAIASATQEGNENTEEDKKKAGKNTDDVDDTSEELDENDKKHGKETDGVDTNLSGDSHGSGADGGKGGLGGPGDGKSGPALNSSSPQNQAGGGGAPQMPQMPSGGGAPSGGGGMPSFPQMTQSDLNNAPNRDQLLSDNRNGEDAQRGTLGDKTNDPDGRKAQELAEKLVNHQPPIPYVWGGGHGGAPGPSGGVRDGGVADSYGDYKKTGVDCSGLSRWMTHQLYGVDAGGTSQSQYASGHPVALPKHGLVICSSRTQRDARRTTFRCMWVTDK